MKTWPLLSAFLNLYTQECYARIHEIREITLRDAGDRRRIEGEAVLPVRIALRPNAEAVANSEQWLMEVSDPNSPKYGSHWTQQDVIEAFKPSEETYSAVSEWLRYHSIESTISANKLWFAFDLSASKLAQLLETEYLEHFNQRRNRFEVSCDQYSLPDSLAQHIEYITPGIKASDTSGRSKRSREYLRTAVPANTIQSRSSKNRQVSVNATAVSNPIPTPPPFFNDDLSHCSESVSPACIRALYNFSVADPSVAVSPDNAMGIFEEYSLIDRGSLNHFYAYYASEIPQGTTPIQRSIDGAFIWPEQAQNWTRGEPWAHIPGTADWECTLDAEVALPIVYPQNISIFQTDDPPWAEHTVFHYHFGLFTDFLDAIDGSYCTYSAFNETGNDPKLDPHYPDRRKYGYNATLQCGVYKPTNVISLSWDYPELTLPFSYSKRQCLEFLKLGLQGASIFVSSGDGGVGDCTRHTIYDRIFGPGAAAACPWITSVGATFIQRNHTPYSPEAVTQWSGGGFSIIHDRPAYQDGAVSSYFDEVNPGIPYFCNGQWRNSTGRYNRNGRGFPDVSANGHRIATIEYAGGEHVYQRREGTSASAPIVAGLFNRIIEERIRAGKGALGFLNPTLYKNSGLLNDITIGANNQWCDRTGFETAPGWDPASGLGTPNYSKLLDFFLALP